MFLSRSLPPKLWLAPAVFTKITNQLFIPSCSTRHSYSYSSSARTRIVLYSQYSYSYSTPKHWVAADENTSQALHAETLKHMPRRRPIYNLLPAEEDGYVHTENPPSSRPHRRYTKLFQSVPGKRPVQADSWQADSKETAIDRHPIMWTIIDMNETTHSIAQPHQALCIWKWNRSSISRHQNVTVRCTQLKSELWSSRIQWHRPISHHTALQCPWRYCCIRSITAIFCQRCLLGKLLHAQWLLNKRVYVGNNPDPPFRLLRPSQRLRHSRLRLYTFLIICIIFI